MATAKTKTETINLPELKIKTATITLHGTTPLIVHRFSEKAIKEMLAKMTGEAQVKKEFKNPEQDYLDSLYLCPDGTPGFPAIAFKSAAVDAANDAGIQKVLARRAFHVIGNELLPIRGEHRMREDTVRVGISGADIRHRAEFPEWEVTVPIAYNSSIISLEQLVNLFNIAGFGVGVGEWRPEKNGLNGMWEVTEVTG